MSHSPCRTRLVWPPEIERFILKLAIQAAVRPYIERIQRVQRLRFGRIVRIFTGMVCAYVSEGGAEPEAARGAILQLLDPGWLAVLKARALRHRTKRCSLPGR